MTEPVLHEGPTSTPCVECGVSHSFPGGVWRNEPMNGAIPGNFNHRAERRSTASKLEDVAEIARGAYGNEQKTRERVDALETNTKRCQALLSRGFLGRLRWLLTGR